jgi:hypothetical protein
MPADMSGLFLGSSVQEAAARAAPTRSRVSKSRTLTYSVCGRTNGRRDVVGLASGRYTSMMCDGSACIVISSHSARSGSEDSQPVRGFMVQHSEENPQNQSLWLESNQIR